MKRIAIFVDGSNFKHACNTAGFQPDYVKLRKFFEKEGDVVGCYYFTAMPPRHVESSIRGLTDFLEYNGWSLITKETKTIYEYAEDGTSKPKYKGNMDIEMVVHAFRMQEWITDLILCSGDGDFVSMVEELQSRALRVTAMSLLIRNVNDVRYNIMDDRLRRTVQRFINIDDIKSEISMPPREPTDEPSLSYLKRTRT